MRPTLHEILPRDPRRFLRHRHVYARLRALLQVESEGWMWMSCEWKQLGCVALLVALFYRFV